jgi:hypothetical protein
VVKPPTPGGGGPRLRKQLTILRDFLSEFDFVRMQPDRSVIKGGIPEKTTAQALVQPGRAYAIYLSAGNHANLVLELPAGHYRVEWINPRSGETDKRQDIDHQGGRVTLSSPPYDEDIALKVVVRS